MGVVGKLLEGGQVMLPQDIFREIGAEPGTMVTVRATGAHTVEMTVWPHLTPTELFERYPIEGPIDEAADREAWEREAAREVFGSVPPLTLAGALERFKIEGPIDEARDREAWQDEAATDVIAEPGMTASDELPPLTPAELLERYPPIEGPIDMVRLREKRQDEAVKDIIDE